MHMYSGTDIVSPHGIPVDLLDRLLVVRTLQYSQQEIAQILAIRASTEGLTVEDDALALLSDIGVRSSLRYFQYDIECNAYVSDTLCNYLHLPTFCGRSMHERRLHVTMLRKLQNCSLMRRPLYVIALCALVSNEFIGASTSGTSCKILAVNNKKF